MQESFVHSVDGQTNGQTSRHTKIENPCVGRALMDPAQTTVPLSKRNFIIFLFQQEKLVLASNNRYLLGSLRATSGKVFRFSGTLNWCFLQHQTSQREKLSTKEIGFKKLFNTLLFFQKQKYTYSIEAHIQRLHIVIVQKGKFGKPRGQRWPRYWSLTSVEQAPVQRCTASPPYEARGRRSGLSSHLLSPCKCFLLPLSIFKVSQFTPSSFD